MGRKPAKDRIAELEAAVAALTAQVTDLSEAFYKERDSVRRFVLSHDREAKAVVDAISDIRERIKMIEPNVYPHLGKLLQHIFDTVGSAPEDKGDPVLPPPSKPPSTKQ